MANKLSTTMNDIGTKPNNVTFYFRFRPFSNESSQSTGLQHIHAYTTFAACAGYRLLTIFGLEFKKKELQENSFFLYRIVSCGTVARFIRNMHIRS